MPNTPEADELEYWRPFNYCIDVSNLGRVRRQKKSGKRIYELHTDQYGYRRVGISIKNKRVNYSAHRLVAMVFIPNPENKPEVNHIDGVKENNCVENLEWCTSAENNLHARLTGLARAPRNFGEANGKSRLTEAKIKYAKEQIAKGHTKSGTAREIGVARNTLKYALSGKSWKHLELKHKLEGKQ